MEGVPLCAFLDPTSPCNVVGGLSRPGSPSKTAFFCPAPLGRVTPIIYAKSTSPNCGISFQAKFLLSPLTTALNYNSGERGVTDSGGRYRWHRRYRSRVAGLGTFQVTPQVQYAHACGPPRLQYTSFSLAFVAGICSNEGRDQSSDSHIVQVRIKTNFPPDSGLLREQIDPFMDGMYGYTCFTEIWKNVRFASVSIIPTESMLTCRRMN